MRTNFENPHSKNLYLKVMYQLIPSIISPPPPTLGDPVAFDQNLGYG